jgi:AAA domain, putative AbiEii toxin, Type IV TA system
MIRSIEIWNFWCFSRLKIADCQRINVIVGDNGSGKTALLEAVFFALGGTTELPQRYRQQRGLTTSFSGSSRKIEEALWRDYFYNRDWRQSASIVIKGDGPEARSAAIAFTASSVETSASDPQESIATAPIKVTWIDADGKPHHAVPSVAAGRIAFPSTDEDLPDFFYFPAQQTIGVIEAAERFADMRRHGRQKEFISAIRDEFDWITGLDIDVIASAPVVSAVMHDNVLRPLPNVSGGINRIVGVMLTIASRDRSIVLVDEAENGIYFKHHSAILRILLRCVRQYDCQIFLTTLSQEGLHALVGATDEQVDDLALWRVERTRAGPHVVQFDGRTLKAGIEYGAEVRGEKEPAEDISTSPDM